MELENFNFCQEVAALKNQVELAYLEIGKGLKKIRDQRLFEGQWDSFRLYSEDMMKWSESKSSRLIDIYEIFIELYKFDPKELVLAGGWSNLAAAVPHITCYEDARLWVSELSISNRKDTSIKLLEAKTKVAQDLCEHADHYILFVCRTCGHKHEVLGVGTSSSEIGITSSISPIIHNIL